ncbi:MAG: CDP-alcohol phosphatidyltransferase family protein [Gemmatimonadetes bacterium]|nr:CDP-alcohol phosphatidyltransferase family protein [Gemmatimonadota bacterium]
MNLSGLEFVDRIVDPVTRRLVKIGVHPNALTTAGFVTTVVAGLMYGQDHVRWAGLLVLLGGAFDIFDGRVARLSGLASKFGSFYDSTLDRISEIVVYIGLLSLYNQYQTDLQDIGMIYAIMLAMGGSLMISYTRARAAALGLDCSVGLMQRAERVVLLGAGSLAFGLMWDGLVLSAIIVIVAVLTNVTAFHRIYWVYKRAAGVPLDD